MPAAKFLGGAPCHVEMAGRASAGGEGIDTDSDRCHLVSFSGLEQLHEHCQEQQRDAFADRGADTRGNQQMNGFGAH